MTDELSIHVYDQGHGEGSGEELIISGGEESSSGEEEFIKKHPLFSPTLNRRGWYRLDKSNLKIILVTDNHSTIPWDKDYSPDCFVELEREYEGKRSPSGVYEAVKYACQFFVYYFPRTGSEMWLRSRGLKDFAEEWSLTHDSKSIIKRDDRVSFVLYSAHGVYIPRKELIKNVAIRIPEGI